MHNGIGHKVQLQERLVGGQHLLRWDGTDPYMVIYHDVIYDSEIYWLLNTSKLTLSLVDTGTMSEFRASKDSNIFLPQRKVVRTLEERVTDMTGLSMEMSEEFSLINYGLGGHYVLHTDYHNHFNQVGYFRDY